MKPSCPTCANSMSLTARSPSPAPGERWTYCCEPCRCVFVETLSPLTADEPAMLLDLQASARFGGARH